MSSRIEEELRLLRTRFPDLEFVLSGNWVRLKSYRLPQGWNRQTTDVAFQILEPPQGPYGIYVPTGLQFGGSRPANYSEPSTNVPFIGETWGIFSWTFGDGEWKPATTAAGGSNYLNWALGFAARFAEGI
jgi:hypothetical protein